MFLLFLSSVVVGSVHFRVFPVICHLSKKEDQHLLRCANQVGLTEMPQTLFTHAVGAIQILRDT